MGLLGRRQGPGRAHRWIPQEEPRLDPGGHCPGHTATPTTETQTRTCMGTLCKECWHSRTSHSSGLEIRPLINHTAAPSVPLCEWAASADARQTPWKQPPALPEPTSDSSPSAWVS